VDTPSYRGFRFPPGIIRHAVWLYHRFPLSFREVEELLAERGIVVSYETVRQWRARFGPQYAAGLRRRRPRSGDKWHLDGRCQLGGVGMWWGQVGVGVSSGMCCV
jgi:putative transposase